MILIAVVLCHVEVSRATSPLRFALFGVVVAVPVVVAVVGVDDVITVGAVLVDDAVVAVVAVIASVSCILPSTPV